MISHHLSPKVFHKLNSHSTKENLPHINTAKLNQYQNQSSPSLLDDGFKLLPKKSLKNFDLPQRFKKHNNKIQANMTLMNKTTSDFASTAASKTCSSSFYKPLEQFHKSGSKVSVLSKHRSKISINETQDRASLEPRTLQGIEKSLDQKYNKRNERETLRKVKPYEVMLRLRPRQISKEISKMFHENKHLYMLSRFTLLELKSYYCAILKFAGNQPRKFKYAFEIMLNLANVTVRENIMSECIKDLMTGGLSFTKFLTAFTNIQEKLRKQAIIDYFEILLSDITKVHISYDELTKTFEGRMKKQVASELCILLYEKLGKEESESISKKQIHTLCYENDMFCTMFCALNNENMLGNKLMVSKKPEF